MKKIILMIIVILALFCTVALQAGPQDNKLYKGSTEKILEIVSPSVVKVVAENHRRYIATGIAIDANSVISHRNVIPRHYNKLYIQTHDGKRLLAKVKGKDRKSSLLVLEVSGNQLKPIKRAVKSKPGDWVAIVGAFYRSFPAIYDGHVSSVNDDSLLLDAPAAPGSSGAAVVNRKGELIAVVRGRYAYSFAPDYKFVGPDSEVIVQSSRSGHKELCYAVPTKRVLSISKDLKRFGKVKRGWLGVNLQGDNEWVAISNVLPKSPAALAGLRKGDVLLELKGDKIKTIKDVQKIVRRLKPNQEIEINVLRGEKNQTIVAVIGDADKRHYEISYEAHVHDNKSFPDIAAGLPTPENFVFRVIGSRNLGVETLTLNADLARAFKVREGKGLMISKVLKDTAAAKAGLMPKDIIAKIGGRTIAKNIDLREALNELAENQPIKVMIYRDGIQKIMTVVPDKNKKFESIFDNVNNSLREIYGQIEEENKRLKIYNKPVKRVRHPRSVSSTEQVWVDDGKSFGKTVSSDSRDTELKAYKEQLEQMKKDQEQMRKDMLKLMKKLEEKEKADKKEKSKEKSKQKDKEKNKK